MLDNMRGFDSGCSSVEDVIKFNNALDTALKDNLSYAKKRTLKELTHIRNHSSV